MISKMEIGRDTINQISSLVSKSNEVGGAIFGIESNGLLLCEAISFKVGGNREVRFDEDDIQLFYPPNGLRLLGSWHTHPNCSVVVPSSIDYCQWSKWNAEYIHLIAIRSKVVIFNATGKLIYEENT